MNLAAVLVAAVVAGLIAARQRLLARSIPQRHAEPFDGVVYRVGSAHVAERHCASEPAVSVVCMHGYLEDMRYFTHLYADPDIQLILINSADYHLPVLDPQLHDAEWAQTPQEEEGSVEYDAEVLVQALAALPRGRTVRVHGHSRGGAVVLEAAARRPDLFEQVEVVLEAPVLPQAKTKAPVTAFGLWLVPLLLPLWQRQPISKRNRRIWGRLDDPRKREIIAGLPFAPRRTRTLVANLRLLARWMQERDHALYRNVRGIVLIPEQDKVLDHESMLDSARRGGDRLQVVMVPDCSHFVSFDQPAIVPALARQHTG